MDNLWHMPSVFQRDANGMALPALTDGMEWAKKFDMKRILTVMLDGVMVKMDLVEGKWQLWSYDDKGGLENIPMFGVGRTDEEAAILRAYDKLGVKSPGIYMVYGKGIKGDPHRIDGGPLMMRISPCDHNLIVKVGGTGIRCYDAATVEEFYSSVKQELSESPEIKGLVFQYEGSGLQLLNAAKVTRREFGLPWPAPVKPEQTQVLQTSAIPCVGN